MKKQKQYGFSVDKSVDPLYVDTDIATISERGGIHAKTFNAAQLGAGQVISRALLSAFYRCYGHRTVGTAKTCWTHLRMFSRFLSEESIPDSIDELDEDLLDRFLDWSRRAPIIYKSRRPGKRYTAKTRHYAFRTVQRVCTEVHRPRGKRLRQRSRAVPGVGRAGQPKQHLPKWLILQFLAAAKRDIRAIWKDFESQESIDPSSPLGVLMSYFKEEHGGLVPPGITPIIQQNSVLHYALQRVGGVEPVCRRLCPTVDVLFPFMFIMGYHTAANAYALYRFECDAMERDPLMGDSYWIRWWKGRSKHQQSVLCTEGGFYSAPAVFQMVLALTEPLRRHSPKAEQKYLFLVRGHKKQGRVGLGSPYMWWDAAKRFAARHNIKDDNGRPPEITLDRIRPTVLAHLYRTTKNPAIVKRFANHRNFATTFQYVVDPLTDEMHDVVIARSQARLFRMTKPTRRPSADQETPNYGRATRRSGDCANPYDSPRRSASNSICPAWLAPFNDPGLVIPPVAKHVAEVLRQRDAIIGAAATMNATRYNKIYAPIVDLIDNGILSRMPEEVVSQAHGILAKLPPLPVPADE